MAVKALGRGREQQGQLGLRVDDAVAARRAQMRRRAGLRVVPPASDSPREDGEVRTSDFARRTRFASPATRADVARPPAPVSSPGHRGEPESAPAPRVVPSLESDTMFETAVAQAQQVATPVRAVERVHAEEVGEPREPAQVAREEQVSAAPATRGYRFTLRGQRVLVALGFAAAIAAGAIAGTLIGPPELPEETATMVVQSGDSLWSIASSIAEPGEDLGPVMSEIRQLNGLETAHIASGQELVVPSN